MVFLHGIGGGACMPDIGSVGTCAARVSGKGNSFCHISLLKKTYSFTKQQKKAAARRQRLFASIRESTVSDSPSQRPYESAPPGNQGSGSGRHSN